MVPREPTVSDDDVALQSHRSPVGGTITNRQTSPTRGQYEHHGFGRPVSPIYSTMAQQEDCSSSVLPAQSSSPPKPLVSPEPSSPTSTQNPNGYSRLSKTVPVDGSVHHRPRKPVLPVSSISLPSFRQTLPKLYWPTPQGSPNPRRQVLVSEMIVNPFDGFCERFIRDSIGSSHKSHVLAGIFEHENGEDEWLAVKITHFDNKEDLNGASELENLISLKHNHIVAVVGTYREIYEADVEKRYKLGLLLFPLAPTDLTKRMKLLSLHNSKREEEKTWKVHPLTSKLLSYFACLCRAVLYLHAKQTKHRDIKPGNILIDQYNIVCLADFDLSKKYQSNLEAVSQGGINFTIEYAPRSVINNEPMGYNRDVNCLGFVFLEMATIIFGETHEDMVNFLTKRPKCTRCSKWDHVESNCAIFHSRRPKSQEDEEDNDEANRRLVFSEALSNNRVHEWIAHLRDIPTNFPGQMPHEQFFVDGKDRSSDFLDMLLKMMLNEDQYDSASIMSEARDLFSQLADHACDHCHPDKTTYGNSEPVDRQKLSPPSRDLERIGRLRPVPETESQLSTDSAECELAEHSSSQGLNEDALIATILPTDSDTAPALPTTESKFHNSNTSPQESADRPSLDETNIELRVSPATTWGSHNDPAHWAHRSEVETASTIETDVETCAILTDDAQSIPALAMPYHAHRSLAKATNSHADAITSETVVEPPTKKPSITWQTEEMSRMSSLVSGQSDTPSQNRDNHNLPQKTIAAFVQNKIRHIPIDDIVGKWVLIFDPQKQTTGKILTKSIKNYKRQNEGFLVPLPQTPVSKLVVPRIGIVKLWKVFGIRWNCRRMLGRLRWMFVIARLTEVDKAEATVPNAVKSTRTVEDRYSRRKPSA